LSTVALAEVNLVRVHFGRTIRLRKVSRFTSFQLVSPGFSYQGKKIGTGRLKTYVFSYEERTRKQVFADCQCPYHARFTYESALRGFPRFRFTLFHLVALTTR